MQELPELVAFSQLIAKEQKESYKRVEFSVLSKEWNT